MVSLCLVMPRSPPGTAAAAIVAVRSASFVVSSRPAELCPHVGVALAEAPHRGQAAADTPPSWNSGGRSRRAACASRGRYARAARPPLPARCRRGPRRSLAGAPRTPDEHCDRPRTPEVVVHHHRVGPTQPPRTVCETVLPPPALVIVPQLVSARLPDIDEGLTAEMVRCDLAHRLPPSLGLPVRPSPLRASPRDWRALDNPSRSALRFDSVGLMVF